MFKLLSFYMSACLYKKRVTQPVGSVCGLPLLLSTELSLIYRCLFLYCSPCFGAAVRLTIGHRQGGVGSLYKAHIITHKLHAVCFCAANWRGGECQRNEAEHKVQLAVSVQEVQV